MSSSYGNYRRVSTGESVDLGGLDGTPERVNSLHLPEGMTELDIAVARLAQRNSPHSRHHPHDSLSSERTGQFLSQNSRNSHHSASTASTAVERDREYLRPSRTVDKTPYNYTGSTSSDTGSHWNQMTTQNEAWSGPIRHPITPPGAALSNTAVRYVVTPSRAFSRDPEQYAPDGTPNTYHMRLTGSQTGSRSPTPSSTPDRLPSITATPQGPLRAPKSTMQLYPSLRSPGLNESSRGKRGLAESTTMHFGVPPRRQQRRNRDVKKMIPLTHGHLVIDLEVPSKLIMPERGREESLYCRYTGVTCDPDDFAANDYFLRQNISGRETEIAIGITMFNEDEVLLCRTLYGVMSNIRELCARKSSRTWGKDAWKKVVVIIVADGRKHVHRRILDCLAILGVYQPGRHMTNAILGEQVTAHLFEYTTTMALDASLHFQLMTPTQIIFCMKERNQKKINSHRWFFNAFSKLLQPKVCVLLDVGTRPASKSIYHLWKTFDLNSNVGGACGEIAVYKGPLWRELVNPLVAAQNFEYKMSNILDKPLESILGYITVLPGAFSAYRYIALQNGTTGRGPLSSYFKGEIAGYGHQQGIFSSNMYLAEDRILCFELIAKHGHNWILHYVKGAVGETDVPRGLPEFISQRRRWLNGSLFASVYALVHFPQILWSDHSVARKTALMIETGYNFLNLCFSWFSLGNFYLFFMIITSSLEDLSFNMPWAKYVNAIFQYLFGGTIAACFLFAMGNKPNASKWKYKSAAIFFSLISTYMILSAILCAIQVAKSGETGPYSKLILSILCTFGLWSAASILALDPAHLITSALPYMLLSPTYVIILNIFAFSNLDDISWGTKEQVRSDDDLGVVKSKKRGIQNVVEVELPPTEEKDVDAMYVDALENLKTRKPKDPPPLDVHAAQIQEAKDYYANIRTNLLLFWVLSNALLVVLILGVGNATATFSNDASGLRTRTYMTCVLVFVAISSVVRFIGSTLYLVARLFTG